MSDHGSSPRAFADPVVDTALYLAVSNLAVRRTPRARELVSRALQTCSAGGPAML
jgi:hypothetical protein